MLTARQQHCLRGIGIHTWRERQAIAADDGMPGTKQPAAAEHDVFADPADLSLNPPPAVKTNRIGDEPRVSKPASPADLIDPEKRDLSPNSPTSDPDRGKDAVPAAVRPSALDTWDDIIASIHACQACELARNCTRKVPGVGNRQADLMIVGEGPGRDEDIQGEPFVGRSGQLLDRMLAAIGLDRQQVYITNIVKCRPPNNRDPQPEEARHCRAFLEAQIERIAPRVILSVGRVSAHNLLGSDQPVGKMIRQLHTLPGSDIPVKVTYHPAYLLRNPSAKAIAWQDMKLLYQMLQ